MLNLLEKLMAKHRLGGGSKREVLDVLRNPAAYGPAGQLLATDFGAALADTAGRVLIDTFKGITPRWTRWARALEVPGPAGAAVYGLAPGRLPEVEEGGEYPTLNPDVAGRPVSLTKYGVTFELSWEALINDDLMLLEAELRRASASAVLTEDAKLVELLESNPTVDGTPFFDPPRGNLATGSDVDPPSTATITAAREALAAQTDAQGRRLGLNLAALLVPPGLADEASSALRDYNAAASEPDRVALLVEPLLSGPAWYALADPNVLPAAGVAFRRGQREPELLTRLTPTGAYYSVRHMFCPVLLCPAAIYKNPGE